MSFNEIGKTFICGLGLGALGYFSRPYIKKILQNADQNEKLAPETHSCTLKVALERLQKQTAVLERKAQPTQFKLIASGREKKIYTGYENGLPIHDIVYMIAKASFWNPNGLKNEVEDCKRIQKLIYHEKLRQCLNNLGCIREDADRIVQRYIEQFPTLASFAKGVMIGDPRLESILSQGDFAKSQIAEVLDSYKYLAIEFFHFPSISIEGKQAIGAMRAKGDLDEVIRKERSPFPKSYDFALQLALGFKELHAHGYIHGDTKLENVLVYEMDKPTIKIADWGKCKSIKENEIGFHTGNRRHMPPERLSSQKGEVFGVGMMLVRVLEEEFLDPLRASMLIEPIRVDLAKYSQLRGEGDPLKCRKGIERFLSIMEGSPETDFHWTDFFSHVTGSLRSFAFGSKVNIDVEIGRYLEVLQDKLQAAYGGSPKKNHKIEKIISVIKSMLLSDPSQRISMDEAVRNLRQVRYSHRET